MATAIWKGHVLAQSEDIVMLEGNVYFPRSATNIEYFQESDATSHCGWKGDANYYNIIVDGAINSNAAWYYKTPYEKALHIKNHIAFWNGVEVQQ